MSKVSLNIIISFTDMKIKYKLIQNLVSKILIGEFIIENFCSQFPGRWMNWRKFFVKVEISWDDFL